MRVDLGWLGELVCVPALDHLLELLQQAGIEVESVEAPPAVLLQVLVGRVVSLAVHPETERLRIAEVDLGERKARVVSGAPSISLDARVAFAAEGISLPSGVVARKSILGVESEGMLCSKADLGMASAPASADLWYLPDTAEPGTSLEAAHVAWPVLTLAITPNRPDLLSHLGIAREVAAATGERLRWEPRRPPEHGPSCDSVVRILIEDPGCKRYCARVVRDLRIGPSPAWLRDRLEAIGQRPINNVVDVTNYVMFELGQPLHAFDLDKVSKTDGVARIRVRSGCAATLSTLDGQERALHVDDVAICDDAGPLALAGVIGGVPTQVTLATRSVLLESAWFDPARTRRQARRHGLHTESSHRFERGADPGMAARALDRAAALLSQIAGGVVCKGMQEAGRPASDEEREVVLRIGRIDRVLGVHVAAEEAVRMLEPLGIRCIGRNETSLRFAIPTFRPDVAREIDLIEELARRHGYERIPSTLPSKGGGYASARLSDDPAALIRPAFFTLGFSEVVAYGLGAPETQQAFESNLVRILNPVGVQLSCVRASLLPGILEIVVHNERRGKNRQRYFEVGRVARAVAIGAAELPEERTLVSAIMTGAARCGWDAADQKVDFYDVVGVVEQIAAALGVGTLKRERWHHPVWHPGASARLWAGAACVGVVGRLHPEWTEKSGAHGPVYALELDLGALWGARLEAARVVAQGRFPGTRRDVAFLASKEVAAGDIQDFLRTHAGGALGSGVIETVDLFDVYRGKQAGRGRVSLAFAIHYRSNDRTLTDQEVNDAFLDVISGLRERFGVEVRQ